jgi:hypothetical protein
MRVRRGASLIYNHMDAKVTAEAPITMAVKPAVKRGAKPKKPKSRPRGRPTTSGNGETMSKRLTLLVTPSEWEGLKKIAAKLGVVKPLDISEVLRMGLQESKSCAEVFKPKQPK